MKGETWEARPEGKNEVELVQISVVHEADISYISEINKMIWEQLFQMEWQAMIIWQEEEFVRCNKLRAGNYWAVIEH